MLEVDKYITTTHHIDINGRVGLDDDKFNQAVKDYIDTGWKVKSFSVEDGDMYAEFTKSVSAHE